MNFIKRVKPIEAHPVKGPESEGNVREGQEVERLDQCTVFKFAVG
jgi:hypothetical protein